MKMVDFDVAEHQYRRATKINEDIAKLNYPQKYVLLEAFGQKYSLEIQEVMDTAFLLKLTDDAIKHYTRVENKIMNENKKLKKENEELKTSKEYWRKKCLSKDSYNKFHFKPPIWFTQDITLTDKQARKVAKAIEQDLKQRRIKNE